MWATLESASASDDQHLEELAQRGAATALGGRHAERSEPRLFDQRDRRERRLELPLALRGALGDRREQPLERGRAGEGVFAQRGRRHRRRSLMSTGWVNNYRGGELPDRGSAGEALVADHGEELQPLGGLASRGGGEDDEALGLVLGGQHLAVELEQADGRVEQALAGVAADADFVAVPEVGELGAFGEQEVDQLARFGVLAGAPVDRAQAGDVGARGQLAFVLGRVCSRTSGWVNQR